jgi:GT2 family glycosyltransferase
MVSPKVSILLTSYNHAKYLRESIESVLNQTYKNFELIIWDDASTDDSWNIITSYTDKRIRSFKNETNQFIEYFRKAISEVAKGEYIAIHHSDDIWESDKLEKQVAFLDTNPQIGAVFSSALIIGEDGEPFENALHFYYKAFDQPNRTRHEWLNYFFYRGNALCHPSVLIRKTCYDECGLYRYGLAQSPDFDMWVRLCLKYDIHVLPEKLVRFRVRVNEMNSSGYRPETHIRSQFEFLQVLYNYTAISTYEELKKIFPIAEKYAGTKGADLEFVLGMVALEAKPYNFTELFGLSLLFEALNDPDRAKNILISHGFSHIDFIKLTGEHDVFSVELIASLSEQMHALSLHVESLLIQVDSLSQERNALLWQVQQVQEERNALLWQVQEERNALNGILQSRSWKFIQYLQKQRLRIAPIGSIQDRSIRLMFAIIGVWRQGGIRGIIEKIKNRYGGRSAENSLVSETEYLREHPRVSVVIPVYNAFSMTKECLQSLYKTKSEVDFEVIVVNNASKDGTSKWLETQKKDQPNLEVITMKENIGFGPATNVGIRRSKGDYIVILNNDTVVSTGWLEKLLEIMEGDPSVGIVSPVTNFVGEGPQIDPAAKDLSPDMTLISDYAISIAERTEIKYEPNRLVFFCVMLRRELIDKIGYIDETYEKGNFEDDDYCLRTRMAGYRLAIAQNSFVFHHGSTTFKQNRISHDQYMERNRERFYKKAGRISIAEPRVSSGYKTKKKDISVIVRTKDRPFLLQRALTSLANQTFKDFEIVLVNDGGGDVSSLLEAFESQVSIQYVNHSVSKGRTAAVNAGIQNSSGMWLSYLDDDDIVYPWHLESLFQATQMSGEKFVYGNYNRALFLKAESSSPDKLIGTSPWEYSRNELLIQNHIPIHTWLHHKECVDKVGLWNEELDRLEDYEFLLRLSSHYSFYHLSKVTCEYRYYLDSANSIYTDRFKTVDALENIYQRHPVEDANLRYCRQEILDNVNSQTKKIQQIRSKIGPPLSEDAATREIIRLVVGI